jgi:hypothetical protein
LAHEVSAIDARNYSPDAPAEDAYKFRIVGRQIFFWGWSERRRHGLVRIFLELRIALPAAVRTGTKRPDAVTPAN